MNFFKTLFSIFLFLSILSNVTAQTFTINLPSFDDIIHININAKGNCGNENMTILFNDTHLIERTVSSSLDWYAINWRSIWL